jgi:hypothetical protein
MLWDKQLEGCFGGADGIFAGHPSDESRAFAWLTSLRRRNVGWAAARKQIRKYLKSRNARPAHITQQVRRARRYLKLWLLD